MAINTLPNGYILNGDYRIIRVLGQGGFGVTYLAEDVNLGHKVVIKEFMPQSMSVRDQSQYTVHPYTDGETMFSHMLNRFLEEAKLLATLRHPSIVKVTRFLKANNTAYFVMDYEEGITFEDYLKKHSTLNEDKLLSIMMPILEGAKYIHSKGVLHRDIAPDNIFLRKNGMPMLIDFGAARNEVAQKSQSLSAIVKEGYSPPEQFTAENQSPATDIYALGAVMYRAITGKKTPNAMSRAMSKNSDNAIENELSKYRGKYNDNLLNAIKKSLNIQVEDRFQSVGDFQKAISSGVIPPPPPPDEQLPPPPPNNNGKIVLAIMVALFIGIGSYIYMGKNKQDTTTYTVASTPKNPDNEKKEDLEQLRKEKAEAERKAQQAEIERLKREKAEAERKAQQAEIERLKREKAEAERKAQCDKPTVKEFLSKYLYNGMGNNIDEALSFYNDTVSPYYSKDYVTINYIIKDKKRYISKFPERYYHLKDIKMISTSIDDCRVSMDFTWNVKTTSGITKEGESKTFVKLIYKNNKFYISGIKDLEIIRKSSPKPTISKTNNQLYRVVNVAYDDTLNVRTEPYVSNYNKIGELSPNATNINLLYCKNNNNGTTWCKIQYGNLKGWVVKRCLAPMGSYINRVCRVIKIPSDDTLNVRVDAGVNYRKVGELAYDATGVRVIRCKYSDTNKRWCKVSHRFLPTSGWVRSKYLSRGCF